MGMIEELQAMGADTADALTRFMGNGSLYERMLKKLPKVVDDTPVLEYANSGDFETAISNAHALKGVTGNLSLTPLFTNYTKIVDLYRSGEYEQATKLLSETVELQQKFLDVILKYS